MPVAYGREAPARPLHKIAGHQLLKKIHLIEATDRPRSEASKVKRFDLEAGFTGG